MVEIQKAYIEELEQRLSDWLHEINELEMRMKKANMEAGSQMYVQIQELRQKCDDTKAKLQTLREADHSEWQQFREELEKGWAALRKGLDKMAKGFVHEWDQPDK